MPKKTKNTSKSKTQKKIHNYAFIDAQNLHMAIGALGWKIDYNRFRTYLKEHYHVTKAYMFMGFKPDEQQLYNFLQEAGFILLFKPILELKSGQVKGNCDAELVLQVMIDYPHYDKAVLVTGDGDFYCLINHLQEKNKLHTILAPTAENCSSLIRKIVQGELTLVSDLRKKIEYKRRLASKKVTQKNVTASKKQSENSKKTQKKDSKTHSSQQRSESSQKQRARRTAAQKQTQKSKTSSQRKKGPSRAKTPRSSSTNGHQTASKKSSQSLRKKQRHSSKTAPPQQPPSHPPNSVKKQSIFSATKNRPQNRGKAQQQGQKRR